jgi:hypothetical protein
MRILPRDIDDDIEILLLYEGMLAKAHIRLLGGACESAPTAMER